MKILASWLVVRPLNTHIIYQVGQNYIIHPARVQQVHTDEGGFDRHQFLLE
jgi:hypothetical protein